MGRWLIVLCIAACGGGDPAGGLALSELHRDEIRANCDYFVRCGLFADHGRCTRAFRLPDDRSLATAVQANKVHYDAAAAVECHAQLAARNCDVTQQNGRFPEICNRVLIGQTDAGESCAFNEECSSRSCLLGACPPGECCPGECEAGERGPIGAPCMSDLQCVVGAFCGADRTCVGLVVQGGSCRSDGQCEIGLGCAGKTALMDGTCEVLPAIGSACVGGRCAEVGAVCDAQTQCVPAGLAGAPCSTDDHCSRFYECGAAGTCEEVPQLGEPCTVKCAGASFCGDMTMTCVELQADGVFCQAAQECEGRFCVQREVFAECATAPVCF